VYKDTFCCSDIGSYRDEDIGTIFIQAQIVGVWWVKDETHYN
jgi:hypothetical protein